MTFFKKIVEFWNSTIMARKGACLTRDCLTKKELNGGNNFDYTSLKNSDKKINSAAYKKFFLNVITA